MENTEFNKKFKNRIEESIAFRKECFAKGISLKDAMREKRAKLLANKK